MSGYSPPFYFHTVRDVAGTVGSLNLMSVFNPAGSGRAVVFVVAEVRSYAIGATVVASSITSFRTTAASGGTLIAASDVSRLLTIHPDPVAEVRENNPTTTNTGLGLNAFPPPISTGAGDTNAGSTQAPVQGAFTCLPGQGLVANVPAGDIDQRWNVTLTWFEVGL